ncbi:MAG TPA: trehalose-6-phosphate synthase, partial [Nocardioides sp.]|nr:trehalose-6-phosphate synthase [Nocardioides sp.]
MSADLVIVANRLPVDRVELADGSPGWRGSPGGLVTAVEPVMRANDGTWIGWPGGTESDLEPFDHDGMHLVPMSLTAEEIKEFYEGFSNATIWPIYHDLVTKPEFHREWWDAYVSVNQRFAEKAADIAAKGATVWVHDYQLQLVPQILRELRPDLRIGFYLHIPFPPTELFQQLPWRRQILEGLLGADLVGFQMPGASANFVRLVRQRVGHKTHRDLIYLPDGRTVRAAAFPISIDVAGFEELARSESVAARAVEIREALGNPRKVFLGIDRLDYTKGIIARLRAFGELIEDGHLDVEDAVFV